jgi:hypothetical protein
MIPTWMGIEKVVQEMDSVRKGMADIQGNEDVDAALYEADTRVRSLSLESDAEAVHRAWRAVTRAEQAVESAIRLSSPRRRAR